MATNRATYLEDNVDKAVTRIARARRWSISQTIAELVSESETLRKELSRNSTKANRLRSKTQTSST